MGDQKGGISCHFFMKSDKSELWQEIEDSWTQYLKIW